MTDVTGSFECLASTVTKAPCVQVSVKLNMPGDPVIESVFILTACCPYTIISWPDWLDVPEVETSILTQPEKRWYLPCGTMKGRKYWGMAKLGDPEARFTHLVEFILVSRQQRFQPSCLGRNIANFYEIFLNRPGNIVLLK